MSSEQSSEEILSEEDERSVSEENEEDEISLRIDGNYNFEIPEILYCIFQFLDGKDIIVLTRVSKMFREVGTSDLLWSHVVGEQDRYIKDAENIWWENFMEKVFYRKEYFDKGYFGKRRRTKPVWRVIHPRKDKKLRNFDFSESKSEIYSGVVDYFHDGWERYLNREQKRRKERDLEHSLQVFFSLIVFTEILTLPLCIFVGICCAFVFPPLSVIGFLSSSMVIATRRYFCYTERFPEYKKKYASIWVDPYRIFQVIDGIILLVVVYCCGICFFPVCGIFVCIVGSVFLIRSLFGCSPEDIGLSTFSGLFCFWLGFDDDIEMLTLDL